MNWFRINFEKDIKWHIQANNKDEALEIVLEQMELATGISRDKLVRPQMIEELKGDTVTEHKIDSKETIDAALKDLNKANDEMLHKAMEGVEKATEVASGVVDKLRKKNDVLEKRIAMFNSTREEISKDIKRFMRKMKKKGVKVNVQARARVYGGEYAGIHMSSMSVTDALGALETAKLITQDGMRAHQAFDGMVQAMEQRPDLIERFHKVMRTLDHKGPEVTIKADGEISMKGVECKSN